MSLINTLLGKDTPQETEHKAQLKQLVAQMDNTQLLMFAMAEIHSSTGQTNAAVTFELYDRAVKDLNIPEGFDYTMFVP